MPLLLHSAIALFGRSLLLLLCLAITPQGSNAYSAAECCLLAWMAAHMQRAFPQHTRRVADFGSDLADGVVLFALLLNHWPALAVHKGKLRWVTWRGGSSCFVH